MDLNVRATDLADVAAVDALLATSYPRLLAADYPPSVLVTAIPLIARARPELVTSGRYYGAFLGDRLVGAGGWSARGPSGEDVAQIAHVRHFVTDPDQTRRGVGSAILTTAMEAAAAAGHTGMACYSTRTAVRFYEANGFAVKGEVDIDLRPGITFPAVAMVRGI